MGYKHSFQFLYMCSGNKTFNYYPFHLPFRPDSTWNGSTPYCILTISLLEIYTPFPLQLKVKTNEIPLFYLLFISYTAVHTQLPNVCHFTFLPGNESINDKMCSTILKVRWISMTLTKKGEWIGFHCSKEVWSNFYKRVRWKDLLSISGTIVCECFQWSLPLLQPQWFKFSLLERFFWLLSLKNYWLILSISTFQYLLQLS